jgi:hypothetical protein
VWTIQKSLCFSAWEEKELPKSKQINLSYKKHHPGGEEFIFLVCSSVVCEKSSSSSI